MNSKKITILLVEDEPSHRIMIRKNIENQMVKNPIMEVEDGQSALDYIYGVGDYADRHTYPEPDLVLLDINMPKIDGFEVLERLKSDPDKRHIPIVMLTSSASEVEVARSYRNGANAYVTKPMEFSRLAEKLRQLILFWVLTSEFPPHEGSNQ